MESFYGGRQGASFVIKDKFKYISNEDPAYIADLAAYKDYKEKLEAYEEDPENVEKPVEVVEPTESDIMATCLAKPNYTQTWYNEYCIIDTTNKNNPHNGKIYRRTIDTTENKLLNNYECAEYVGTIVGPSSGAAFLKPQSGLLKFEDMRNQLATSNGEGWDGLGLAKDGKLVTYDPSFAEENINSTWPEKVELEQESMEINRGIVYAIDPDDKTIVTKETIIDKDGKTTVKTTVNEDEIVNDIKYNWFNVRKNTENNEGVVESWCYIGFEVPTPSFTVEALYKTPGTKPEVYLTDNAKDFAFWHDIHFDIPGGIRGISVESIFTNDTHRKNVDDSDQISVQRAWSFDNIHYDANTDTYSIQGKDDQGNDVIESIEYNSEGPSTISDKLKQPYSTKSLFCNLRIINPKDNAEGDEWPIVLEGLPFFIGVIEEIEYVKFNTKTGHLQISYHNQDDDTWDLRYPIQIDFTTMEDSEYQGLSESTETPVKYNTGEYFITYSYADETKGEQKVETDQLGFVRKVTLDEGAEQEKGTMTFTNSIEGQTQTYDFSYPKTLEFLTTDNLHDGRWKIDYFGAEDKSGQFGFVKSVGITEDENGLNGTMTFNNTIEKETQEFDFYYPQGMDLISDTGEWTIDYFGAEDKSGQLGYVKSAAIDSNKGTITFTNTIGNRTTTQDLIYVKDIDADAETGIFTATYSNSSTEDFAQFDYPKSLEIDQSTGEYTIDYSKRANVTGQFGFVDKATISDTKGTITFHNTATGDDVQSLVYAKSVQMDDDGKLTYTNSASQTLDMGQIVFVDDVVVDDAHRLLIAYTDNSKIETTAEGTVELEGKTYINYGQTIGTLGVTSGPMPTAADDRDNIDAIVAWYNKEHENGMVDGAVSGKLHVVTTDPIDDNVSPISYFVMWYPDEGEGVWKMVSEIAGAPVGIPAQIGKDDDGTPTTGWTYEDYEDVLADGALRFVQMHEITVATTLATPWR